MEYFAARNISPEVYENAILAAYLIPRLPQDKNAKILDYGCGFGQTISALKNLGYLNVIGVDINQTALRYNQDRGNNVLHIDELTVMHKERSLKFDFIIMSHVLEHIDKAQIIPQLEFLRTMIFSTSGSILIIVPNAQSETGCYWAYEDFTHTTLFTAGSLIYVLKMAGFKQVEIIDRLCLEGRSWKGKLFIKCMMWLYTKKREFWMKVTNSHYHIPSPAVYSYEVKALAKP